MADIKATAGQSLAKPKLTSTAKQKNALSLKQQVALFYARKRRKARASS